MGEYKLNSIEDAIKDFKEGKFVIVVVGLKNELQVAIQSHSETPHSQI